MKWCNETHSPVLASIRVVSGGTRCAWWFSSSFLALSCNSSSRRCRKASQCTCEKSATGNKNKNAQGMTAMRIFFEIISITHLQLQKVLHSVLQRSTPATIIRLFQFIELVSVEANYLLNKNECVPIFLCPYFCNRLVLLWKSKINYSRFGKMWPEWDVIGSTF